MKQKDAIKAYLSARKLNIQDASPKNAKVFFELMQALQPTWDFQVQEERKVFAKHPNFDPMSKTIKMEGEHDKNAVTSELKEIDTELSDIGNVESTIDFAKRTINVGNENFKLSGEDYANLEQFLDFE